MAEPATISATCAMESLRRYVESGEQHVREWMAPAVFLLSCGHKRPTNHFEEMGATIECFVCGPVKVEALLMLPEPQWFPHVEALEDLPTPA